MTQFSTLSLPETGPALRDELAVDKPSTRGRILEICRVLFNERSPAEVTTAEIAQAAAISEGNLHYHFPKKDKIVIALFDQFEAAVVRISAPQDAFNRRPEMHRQYLTGWFSLIWDWRFLYAAGVYRLVPSLQPRLRALTDLGQANVRRVLADRVRAGTLNASAEEIDRLVVNAWIIASYWIDYLQSYQGVAKLTRDDMRWGFLQVEAMFMPYAVPKERRGLPLSQAGGFG